MPSQRARVVLTFLSPSLVTHHAAAQNWPSFRGPFASGIADRQDLPTEWNIKTGQNIRWSTDIPGHGHSSPVVWGDRVFLTSVSRANPPALQLGDTGGGTLADDKVQHTWRVLCLSVK